MDELKQTSGRLLRDGPSRSCAERRCNRTAAVLAVSKVAEILRRFFWRLEIEEVRRSAQTVYSEFVHVKTQKEREMDSLLGIIR